MIFVTVAQSSPTEAIRSLGDTHREIASSGRHRAIVIVNYSGCT